MTASVVEDMSGPGAPPFEVRTLFHRLWRRRRLVVTALICSAVAGALGGIAFGRRTYDSQTILLYRPSASVWNGVEEAPYDSLSLATQMNMVKIPTNLAEVRRRLSLRTTLDRLGAALEVHVQDNTNLMTISTTWFSAEDAAALANTTRDVYLEHQRRLRYQAELMFIERMHREAVAALGRIGEQITNLDRVRDQLNHKLNMERATTPEVEGLADINIRIERLRRAIVDDQEYRANMALLAQEEIDLDRAEELRAEGGLSDAEFGRIRARYERRRALTEETDEIRQWRQELDMLEQVVVTSDAPISPASAVVKEVMLRTVQEEIARVAAAQRVSELERLRADRIARLAALDSDTNTTTQEEGVRGEPSDFRVVTSAKPPTSPSSSNRKLVAAGISLLLGIIALGMMLGIEMIDPTIESGLELTHKLALPSLGTLPAAEGHHDLLCGANEQFAERYRLLAGRIRRTLPERGATVLFTSAIHGEGKTTVAINVARVLGHQGNRVLVIDAGLCEPPTVHSPGASRNSLWLALATTVAGWMTCLRGPVDRASSNPKPYVRRSVREILPPSDTPLSGLGAYLSSDAASLTRSVHSTSADNVEILPSEDEIQPDQLMSPRMRSLLRQASADYDVVLIDGPPILDCADGEMLAQLADAVVLVVDAGNTETYAMKRAVDRLAATNTPVIGAVLNRTRSEFLHLE